jgi:hypothetical protein
MYLHRLKFKIEAGKIAACLVIFMLFSLVWVAQPDTAGAKTLSSDAAESLTIRVGYAKGTFAPVKEFTDSDFAGTQQQAYSFIDRLPAPCTTAATGIPLTKLLSEAGIDFNKVKSFAFWATDIPGAPYKTFTKDYLYEDRYYYPNIVEYWNAETQDFKAVDEDSVTDMTYRVLEDRVRVDPMICISDNWQRFQPPNFGVQDTSVKYRLLFGQREHDITGVIPTADNSAKWIYQIDVTLDGTPVTGVSLDKSSAAIGVGATEQLTATVTPGSATDKSVTWSSSDTAVATVSSTGLVKGVATGSATITATTVDGGFTAACDVVVGSSTGEPSRGTKKTEENVVDPVAGGTVSLGSDVSVNIPAGALKGIIDLKVDIQKIASPPKAPSGFTMLGSSFEFTVDGSKSYSFAKPVTLTFTFDAASLSSGATPSVHYYDEVSGQWVNLGGSVSGGAITVTAEHFAKYAVFAKDEEKAVVPGPVVPGPVVPGPVVPNPLEAFSDIKGHWAEKTIGEMVSLGAINGYDDGFFKPDNNITRAEFTTLLMKALIKTGLMPLQGGRVIADTKGHWAQEYIASAASYGIVSGYDDNTFGPDDLVTREQMAVMVVKACDLAPGAAEIQFTDSDAISGWARDAVETMVKDSVMAGYPDNTFQPQGKATRAEAITTLSKALSMNSN